MPGRQQNLTYRKQKTLEVKKSKIPKVFGQWWPVKLETNLLELFLNGFSQQCLEGQNPVVGETKVIFSLKKLHFTKLNLGRGFSKVTHQCESFAVGPIPNVFLIRNIY